MCADTRGHCESATNVTKRPPQNEKLSKRKQKQSERGEQVSLLIANKIDGSIAPLAVPLASQPAPVESDSEPSTPHRHHQQQLCVSRSAPEQSAMCILFVYVDDGSVPGRYRLVLASNRDEFFARPAKPAAPWEENSCVIGGRDMEPGREGGTWLAIGNHSEGRIKLGALLNVTGESKPNVSNGRGPIVANFLTGELSGRAYSEQLLAQDNFGAFNFVSIELDAMVANGLLEGQHHPVFGGTILHTSNAPHSIEACKAGQALGFGNSTLDKPLQKVCRGREQFSEIVAKRNVPFADKDAFVDELMGLLKNDVRHFPDAELTRRAGQHAEFLSSINVRMPGGSYGSRTRTVILIDQSNHMEFIEETLVGTDPHTGEWQTTRIERQFC